MALKLKANIQDVPLNPLADYRLQIEKNNIPKGLTIGVTSLENDVRSSLAGFNSESSFYIKEDKGNFEHSKLHLGKENMENILSLPPSGMKLFLWILFRLDHRSEVIEIHPEKIEKLGLTMAFGSLNTAIKSLEKKGIIKRKGSIRKEKNYWQFFFNPQLMWRGDAKKYFKEVIKTHPDYLDKGAISKPKKTRNRSSR